MTLGRRFLRRLYRRIGALAARVRLVVGRSDARRRRRRGFVAVAEDTGRFYRAFLRPRRRCGRGRPPRPRCSARPSRCSRRCATARASGDDLPAAEMLAIAVADRVGGPGIGRVLVDAASTSCDATRHRRARTS